MIYFGSADWLLDYYQGQTGVAFSRKEGTITFRARNMLHINLIKGRGHRYM